MFGHPHVVGCFHVSNTPTHLLPCMSVCSRVICMCYGGSTPYVGDMGDVSTSVRFLVSVSTSTGCPLCFILYLSCSSLCVRSLFPWLFLLLLQWLWCLLVCHLYHQWPWLPLWWVLLQHWVNMMWSAATPDTRMLWRCSWPCLCATAATSIFNASSSLCQLCHGFSTGRFLFQSWASHSFVYYMFRVCSGVCFLLSGAMLDVIFTPGDSTIGVCTIATPWSLPMAGICATWWWSSGLTRYAQSGCSLHYIESGEPCVTESAVPKPSHLYVGAYSFGCLAESHPIPLPSLHGREGSSFPGLIPSDDTLD